MALTDDDLLILRHVAKHRFLRSTHLIRLLAHRSDKKVTERLAVLFHNGLLDRPRSQLDYYATAGSRPMVYALGNRGAALLAEIAGIERAKVDWTDKNRTARRPFIEHTLLIADLMVALEVAVRARPGARLIEPRDILAAAPRPTRAMPNPFAFQIRTHNKGNATDFSVIPDCVFGLDGVGRGLKYFFLEADRATMPVMRKGPTQTSMFRKFLAYAAGGGAENLFGRQVGIANFRVLTLTTTHERTHSMIAALKEATAGRGLRQFLFTDRNALANAHDGLALPWTTGKGEIVRLLDEVPLISPAP
ncbi:MAG: replication-relaxation family protein [Hyphomicrobium sp.]|nr:replication-relaxation family protein [Hyphomicrobium sp.]